MENKQEEQSMEPKQKRGAKLDYSMGLPFNFMFDPSMNHSYRVFQETWKIKVQQTDVNLYDKG